MGDRAICFQVAATGWIYDYVHVTGNVGGNVETARKYVPHMPCNAPRHGAQCTVCTSSAHCKFPAYVAGSNLDQAAVVLRLLRHCHPWLPSHHRHYTSAMYVNVSAISTTVPDITCQPAEIAALSAPATMRAMLLHPDTTAAVPTTACLVVRLACFCISNVAASSSKIHGIVDRKPTRPSTESND